mmetsp:Transcript_10248/g.37742  ORF Transcript_10248/g.37742 Transcript_10248/m.37742 type:complete len:171 (-) Transcript_10248:1498-2010(-)
MAEMKQMRTDAKSEEKWGEKQIRKEGYAAVKRRAEYELGKLQQRVDALLRDKDSLEKKFAAEGVPCDFELLTEVRHATARIGASVMLLVLEEHTRRENKLAADKEKLKETGSDKQVHEVVARYRKWGNDHLLSVFKFAFKIYQFAGGFDQASKRLFEELGRRLHVLASED